ncbi:hypothetical protein [Bradyrhizobium stylosanthis]|uniref:hypothetical protein n=1 Tax=Bradyrhizobium stylosanthis TaxID=1803665 RepID=UPI0012E94324|nr:hypothetical protein [Bradyrhizobium stylosanthis]
MVQREKISCYLIAPSTVDVTVARSTLRSLNVSFEDVAMLPPSGESAPDVLRRRVEKADFVCGMLLEKYSGSRNRVENVLFELGVAVGLNRPIFIIAEQASLIPLGLASYPHVLGAANSESVLRFHLDAFLKRLSLPTERAVRPPRLAERPPLFSALDESKAPRPRKNRRAEVDRIRAGVDLVSLSERELERAVANALEITGANVAVEPQIADHFRPDVVAWLPRSNTGLGPALLVEVRRRIQGAGYERAIEQMERYMSAAGIRTGVLVSPEASDEIAVRIATSGYVFIVSLNTLFDLVSENNLARRLIEARNRFVHTGA